ncbi:X-linked interleukin-1 receptor accessory protein-like 2 [Macrobrachium nipponense]|uniref:X-linked interleukin-1 receptor accessory protein-like 2 n=1 Tax=Macrobrachium nipponense TaxID=159736 RepID=UPI0030C84426
MGHKKRGIAVLICHLTLLNALQMPSASVVEERPMIQEGFTSSRYGELKCLPEFKVSDEKPDIKWIKPEKSTLRTKSMKNKNIIFTSTVSRKDVGNYTCIATYSNGTRISQTFSVCVTLSTPTTKKPERGTISDETYVPEGHSITLECQAFIGTPRCVYPFKYTLTWSKMLLEHGRLEELTSSDDMDITEPQIIENGFLNGKLNIKKVRSSHYGTYFCNITNENGYLVQEVNITDKVPLKLLQERELWLVCAVIICITLIPFFIYGLQHSMASITLFFKSLGANPSMAATVRKVLPEMGKFPLLVSQKKKVDDDKADLLERAVLVAGSS